MKIALIKNIYKGLALSLMLWPYAISSAFFVNVNDTIAGSEATFQVSGLTTNELVSAVLERPEQAAVNLSFKADANGNVQSEIYGLHLKSSGDYDLKVKRSSLGNVIESHRFSVFPGAPSRFRSAI